MRLVILALALATAGARAGDRVQPGRLLIERPTLENLGFRWYIEGDDNRNAAAAVSFREAGARQWKPGLPMLRVARELVNRDYGPWRAGNLFASSVLSLQPGTKYEVRVELKDPDGGGETRTFTAVTRDVPRAFEGGRKLDVYPNRDLMALYREARPGDILLLHAGVYRGPFTFDRSGEPGKPIVFRGGVDGEAILEGPGLEGDLLDVQRADYLMFENLTMRNARHAILGGGRKGQPASAGLVVRRCRISNVIYGITTYSERTRDWYIADNDLTGTNPTWYPRPEVAYMSPSHTGINMYGRGNVVAHNRVSRFSDGIAPANFGPPVDDPELQPSSNDVYGNEISWAQDDCIETDYGAHNFRVYRNRCFNAHTGISVQPFYGGPVYIIRNEVYGVTALNLKLHNYSAGIVAWHNTLASAGTGFQSFERWQNGHFRNNLFLSGASPNALAVRTGTLTDYSTLDYNGYRQGPIRWFDGKAWGSYRTLAEFAGATGHERHGLTLDYDVFVKAGPPEPGRTVEPAGYDLRLRRGSAAVDAGTPIATINDGYAGRAPDLGCYELGKEIPRYGPRN
ncbi:MAG: hypothetical protein ACE15B_11895 [Bryobacteraceae bacterium]